MHISIYSCFQLFCTNVISTILCYTTDTIFSSSSQELHRQGEVISRFLGLPQPRAELREPLHLFFTGPQQGNTQQGKAQKVTFKSHLKVK